MNRKKWAVLIALKLYAGFVAAICFDVWRAYRRQSRAAR